MNKGIKLSMGIGASSMIMIFVVLVTVTLSTLALGTANADYKLAKKSAENISAFYEAGNKAEEKLAMIGDCLNTTKRENLEEALKALGEVNIKDMGDKFVLSYVINMNEKQSLNVALEVSLLEDTAPLAYKVTSWQVINNSTWEYEEGLGFSDIIIEDTTKFDETE